MKHLRKILCLLLGIMVTGCKTSQMIHRPLSDVSHAVQLLEPEMIERFSSEHPTFKVYNHVPGDLPETNSYVFHIRDVMNSFPSFSFLTVEAASRGTARTKVTVTTFERDASSSVAESRRRDLEDYWLRALTKKLEDTQ